MQNSYYYKVNVESNKRCELNFSKIWHYKWLNSMKQAFKDNYTENVNKWRNIYIFLLELSFLLCFFRIVFTLIRNRIFSLIYNLLIMFAHILGFYGALKLAVFFIILHGALFILMYLIFGVLIFISITKIEDFSEEFFTFIFVYSLMLIDIFFIIFLMIGCCKIGSWYDTIQKSPNNQNQIQNQPEAQPKKKKQLTLEANAGIEEKYQIKYYEEEQEQEQILNDINQYNEQMKIQENNINQFQNQMMQSQNDDLCILCMVNKKSQAIIPCGHVISCDQCLPNCKFKVCPICRGKIAKIQKIYI